MNTEIFDSLAPDFDESLLICAKIIRNGGLVVFPTETVYGLGADATSPEAAKKIYAAKGRPSDNPLIIHLSDPGDAEKYAYTNKAYYTLAELYMPGPITVILRAKETVPRETRGGLDTVAIRCPSHPVAHRLIALAGVPVAAPSANISGSPSPTSARHVMDDMIGRVDAIIDGGESDFGLESTIVKPEDDGSLTLLRPGRITPDELSKTFKVNIASAVTEELKVGEKALSPGMKYRHYAPASPLILLDGNAKEIVDYIKKTGQSNIALLSYDENADYYAEALPDADVISLGARDDDLTVAHRLFALLREIDKKNCSVIYAPLPSSLGIGLAIYNRMIRAAAHTIIKL